MAVAEPWHRLAEARDLIQYARAELASVVVPEGDGYRIKKKAWRAKADQAAYWLQLAARALREHERDG